MAELQGDVYNFDVYERQPAESRVFRSVTHAGEEAPDFTLPTLDGGEKTLSALRGKPVVIEFGSIT